MHFSWWRKTQIWQSLRRGNLKMFDFILNEITFPAKSGVAMAPKIFFQQPVRIAGTGHLGFRQGLPKDKDNEANFWSGRGPLRPLLPVFAYKVTPRIDDLSAIGLQNTVISFWKYRLYLILFTNYSEHNEFNSFGRVFF